MFKKILYPTDFSDCSEKAIPYLKKLKSSGTTDVVILHVIDVRFAGMIESFACGGKIPIPLDNDDILKVINRDAAKKMNSLKKRLSKDFRVKSIIETDIPFNSIIKIAEKEKVSLIILGSHGRSNIEEMLLGSVAEKVVRKSSKPCLVIKR